MELKTDVSSRFRLTKCEIERLRDEFELEIELAVEQRNQLSDEGHVSLTENEMKEISQNLFPTRQDAIEYLERESDGLAGIAVALFVLNEGTWRLMERRTAKQDRMLPMVTIPWNRWDPEAESPNNPQAVKRNETDSVQVRYNPDKKRLMVEGDGGDFCGILEARIVAEKGGIRPLIIPGSPGRTDMVPKYENQRIQIGLDIDDTRAVLNPLPNEGFDYMFTESPKDFHTLGIELTGAGKDFTLRVGRGRESVLRGEVVVYIGKRGGSTDSECPDFRVFLYAIQRAFS
ncbi:hypothetical protein EU538_08745 [Candidatus Thorarchaeota archaeon]|jgi:hypothetical protein|nr:MAG: hypothetical protein EU538_08745 [Candidatus Thorarchaeota archaeon]